MLSLCVPVSLSIDLLQSGLFDCASAVAYVGPGAGLSMLGALGAVALVLLFALLAPLLFVVRVVRSLVGGRRPERSLCLETRRTPAGEERQISV